MAKVVKKPILLFLVFILLATAVNAVVDVQLSTGGLNIVYPKLYYYEFEKNITLNFHVHDKTNNLLDNTTTTCSIHIYNHTGEHLVKTDLIYDGVTDFYYTMNTTILDKKGFYYYDVYCNDVEGAQEYLNESGYISNDFRITSDGEENTDKNNIIAILILLPLILGIIFLVGSATLSEEHNILKIFLFLLSPITFWVSLHFGMISIIKFYNFPELENLLGTTTYWTGLTFFVLLAYFLIYLFYTLVHQAAQRREEKLQY